jgi:hypothetical protein
VIGFEPPAPDCDGLPLPFGAPTGSPRPRASRSTKSAGTPRPATGAVGNSPFRWDDALSGGFEFTTVPLLFEPRLSDRPPDSRACLLAVAEDGNNEKRRCSRELEKNKAKAESPDRIG